MDRDNISGHPGPNGNKFNVDEMLESLVRSATDPTDVTDVNSFSGEYTALNNTIDELNKFLDVWDARHDKLRSEIKEALEEASANDVNSDELEGNDASSTEASTTEISSSEQKVEDSTKTGSQAEKEPASL